MGSHCSEHSDFRVRPYFSLSMHSESVIGLRGHFFYFIFQCFISALVCMGIIYFRVDWYAWAFFYFSGGFISGAFFLVCLLFTFDCEHNFSLSP
jgi:hypothetical protein